MKNLPALQAYGANHYQGEYKYIEDVVRIGYPIRAARTYLRRHLGNKIQIRLVEVKGEKKSAKFVELRLCFLMGTPQYLLSPFGFCLMDRPLHFIRL